MLLSFLNVERDWIHQIEQGNHLVDNYSEKGRRIFNKLSGSMLISAGLAISTLRQ